MPTLDWIGKKAVVNHHREVPYRLIHCDGELSAGDPDAGNLLVQGDNLEALKALLPYYAGKVKCIYIDPPYNTGSEGWVYNDNVASPEIKAWLGKTVGKEAEDLSRNDKWLCMMYPRLRLLREFLREDGGIFVSIGDDEVHHLVSAMKEIFGAANQVAVVPRIAKRTSDKGTHFRPTKDFVVVFARNKERLAEFGIAKDRDLADYKEIDSDGCRYKKSGASLYQPSLDSRPNQRYYIEAPDGSLIIPPGNVFPSEKSDAKKVKPLSNDDKVWRWSQESYLARKEELIFTKGSAKNPLLDEYGNQSKWNIYPKVFFDEDIEATLHPEDVIYNLPNSQATKELNGMNIPFNYAKPSALLAFLINLCTDNESIVLDSFAGSGTTGHAVLDLNKKDNGNRRFILVEMDETIARDITAERLRRVIEGYDKGGDPEKPVEGLGGGFRYCRLGTPLFNEFGDIDGGVIFPDLAAHVFFSETGSPLPKKVDGSNPFIGTHKEKAVYLLFSPAEQGFAREASGNVLTPDALADLPAPSNDFEGVRIVYAEGCTVSIERLKAEGVIFKQIPYQIEGS